jgi:DNA invertase Pin-like site-specific DNA recombinase
LRAESFASSEFTKTSERQYVAYYRVSKMRKGRSSLSVQGQRAAVKKYLEKHPGKVVEEFSETESGRNDKRPQLLEALRICRMRRASLLIARLDRLSRSFSLISNLCESDIEFVAVDLPEANRLTIHLLAAISEYETKQMSDRIKAALAVAKARGVKLGGNKGLTPERIRAAQKAAAIARTAYALARARDLAPLVWQLRGEGKSCRQIATELERLGINPSRGGKWHDSAVRKIFLRTAQEFSVPIRLTQTPTRASVGHHGGHGHPPARRSGFSPVAP